MEERRTIRVVAAVIRDGGRIFATQRGYGEFKDRWECPGGKIEPGETPQQALAREIREELDTEIEVGELIETVEYDYPQFHLTMDCFWCTIKSGGLTLLEAEDSRWLAAGELYSVDWLPADRGLVRSIEKVMKEERKGRDECETKTEIRELDVGVLTENIKEMCIEAAHFLSPDMVAVIENAAEREGQAQPEGAERDAGGEPSLGCRVLDQLVENLRVAGSEMIPICQDCGMAVVFLEVGQDVHFTGGDVTAAVNLGVRQGYTEGYLRKSVVGDPLLRVNTGDNTPAVIHTEIVPGDRVRVTVAPKGFGSENKSRLFMLTPADGPEGVRRAVLETVRAAGGSACPPMVVGVGIGGTMEKCCLLAKKALLREIGIHSDVAWAAEMEAELLSDINRTGIGPAGLGGRSTALAVNIETYPTHIAGLPVAVNICCHANRHVTRVI